MDVRNFKPLRFFGLNLIPLACKCVIFVAIIFIFRSFYLPSYSVFAGIGNSKLSAINTPPPSFNSKFLEVPQIVWGLNNQKIAFARACLTARMLNRTLLMPSLSASLFYKEIDLLEPIPFDEVFNFDKFNSLCRGFVRLGRYSEISNRTAPFDLRKGSGRKWTVGIDLDQLIQFSKHPYDEYEVIRIVGKNPFLWHDHWPVKDYAKIFHCLILKDKISREADKVVSMIREIGFEKSREIGLFRNDNKLLPQTVPYVAVHMRVENDWMIHCKKLEQRLNVSEICSSKEEIVQRVGNIIDLKKTPIVVYVAVADDLLEDDSILSGWGKGLFPLDKKTLGVFDMYKQHSYLIQSAIDYEVCLRSDVFVGNSFSTFSSLVVLDRTRKMMDVGGDGGLCGMDVRWPCYAYNVEGESEGPHPWATNMSDVSLRAISYGSTHVSCD